MEKKVYAVKAKCKDLVLSSSSGGLFSLISDFILSKKGAVVASVYNYEHSCMEFQLITAKEVRNQARGSKYMQSFMNDIFERAYRWMKNHPSNPLLFIGVGCQTDAFRAFIYNKNILSDIYYVDIVCHGVPSPMLWQNYITNLSGNNGTIQKIDFKDKRYGWRANYPIAVIGSKEIVMSEYKKLYYDRVALRPSCHKCPYATLDRNVDITMGDFWGIENALPEFNADDGCSLCIVHTEKGLQLFENIKENADYMESSVENCLQPNLIQPTEIAENRELFWHDYVEKGFRYILKKYGRISIMKKVINKIGEGYEEVNNTSLYPAEEYTRCAA